MPRRPSRSDSALVTPRPMPVDAASTPIAATSGNGCRPRVAAKPARYAMSNSAMAAVSTTITNIIGSIPLRTAALGGYGRAAGRLFGMLRLSRRSTAQRCGSICLAEQTGDRRDRRLRADHAAQRIKLAKELGG